LLAPVREVALLAAMTQLPQRQSLVSQTADLLRESIEKGAWLDRLPSERTLCEQYQISRNTLRTALGQLQRDRLIRPVHGSGNHIIARPRKPGPRQTLRDVGLLSPEPLERLRATQTLWIDELRAMLSERGFRLRVFHGQQYFRAAPQPTLKKLTTQNPHACWILILSNERTQGWFEQHSIPCVVAGSVYPGVDLPFRDLDHRAMCRHAAGVMLAAGHRKVAMLIQKSRRAGDLDSEAGFVEGVRLSSHAEADVVIANHEPTVTGISHALRRLMEQKVPPTALLVANPHHFLAVATRLTQLGWRIPEQVSLISRDDEPYLSYVVPEPARYVVNPHTMAKSLLRAILEQLEGGVVTHRSIRIMPDFIRGESLLPPAQI
jgi:LacI family transcriptional regulator